MNESTPLLQDQQSVAGLTKIASRRCLKRILGFLLLVGSVVGIYLIVFSLGDPTSHSISLFQFNPPIKSTFPDNSFELTLDDQIEGNVKLLFSRKIKKTTVFADIDFYPYYLKQSFDFVQTNSSLQVKAKPLRQWGCRDIGPSCSTFRSTNCSRRAIGDNNCERIIINLTLTIPIKDEAFDNLSIKTGYAHVSRNSFLPVDVSSINLKTIDGNVFNFGWFVSDLITLSSEEGDLSLVSVQKSRKSAFPSRIELENVDGNINASLLQVESIFARNENGNILIEGIDSEKLSLKNTNGNSTVLPMTMGQSSTTGRKIGHVKSNVLMYNSNGDIKFESYFGSNSNCSIDFLNSNGKIDATFESFFGTFDLNGLDGDTKTDGKDVVLDMHQIGHQEGHIGNGSGHLKSVNEFGSSVFHFVRLP